MTKNHYYRRKKARRRRTPGCLPPILCLALMLLAAIAVINLDQKLPQADFASISATPAATQSMPDNRQGGYAAVLADEAPWYLTLVNKWNPLPEDYELSLVEVADGESVDARIAEALTAMLEAAEEAGLDPIVASGYRTAEKQQRLLDDEIAAYRQQGYGESAAKELAEQWVSAPGTSEHQLGIAVDLSGGCYDIYFWLQENSYKYGFIYRYPGDKTGITGVANEPWHYRYVGVEAATDIYEQGLCLEEYLGQAR